MSTIVDEKPKGRWLAFWLVLIHFVAGLICCIVARSYHGNSLPQAAFVGLVFSQTSLVGLWAGFGTSPWLARLAGAFVGLAYLGTLFCLGVDEFGGELVLMVAFAGVMVAVPLVIGRRFGLRIHGSSVNGTEQPTQFSIRQLMIFTFLVATLMTLAKWLRPHVDNIDVLPWLLLITVPFIILGLVAAWLILGTRRPTLATIAVLLLAPLLGFGLYTVLQMTSPPNRFNSAYWITAITAAAIVLIVSLHAIRRCGFRIRRQRKCGLVLGDEGSQKELAHGK